jgi:Ribbon-helix-helix protein, copG family
MDAAANQQSPADSCPARPYVRSPKVRQDHLRNASGAFSGRPSEMSETGVMSRKPPAPGNDEALASKLSAKRERRFVRLSVNLSLETAEIFRSLIDRKGLSISEGIRRAIAVWKFVEDERARGNQIAVVEPNDQVHKVMVL